VRLRSLQLNLSWIARNLLRGDLPKVWLPFGRRPSKATMDWAEATMAALDRPTIDATQFETFAAFKARVRGKKATGED
jgi:hypothetical protein